MISEDEFFHFQISDSDDAVVPNAQSKPPHVTDAEHYTDVVGVSTPTRSEPAAASPVRVGRWFRRTASGRPGFRRRIEEEEVIRLPSFNF